MRPLALVAVFAALAGCSLNYQGKTFKAIEKPHHAMAGEAAEGEAPKEAGFEQAEPVVRTSASFPKGVQPTGKPPVIPKNQYVEGNPSMTKAEGE